jgi:flagellar FliL protein
MSDEKSADAAAAAPPKAGKKRLIMIAAAAVVVLGGGAGAYFAFAGKGEDAKDKKAEHAEKAEQAEKLPAQFVALDPPFVVNFEAGAAARFLQVAVQLMTRDPHMVEFLEKNSPIIRNDLLLLLGNKHVEEVSTNEGKEALRAAALEAVRKIAVAEGHKAEDLEAVYFTSFVMQ